MKKFYPFVMIVLLASLVLAACAPAATPVPTATTAPTAVPTKPAPTNTAVPPSPTPEPAPDMLALMKKIITENGQDKSYGTVAPAGLNTELAEKPPFMLDVREASEVEKDGYIKGSVLLPIKSVLKNLDKLPAQDKPIVVLCASGHRGGFVMVALKLLGYSNVRNLAGGTAAWKKANLPTEAGKPAEPKAGEAPKIASQALFKVLDGAIQALPEGFGSISGAKLNESLAAAKPPVLVDIRRPDEFAKDGYIKGAVNIPYEKLFEMLDKLPAKDQEFVIYCVSGHRAAVVAYGLRMLGYNKVLNLGGGLNGWKSAQLPVEGLLDWNVEFTNFYAAMPKDFYATTPAALNTALGSAKGPFLVDVREAAELEKDGYIKGSIHLPVRSFFKNLDKLPAMDQQIVVLCASGHRASMVMMALRMLGYKDVLNLGGGTGAWIKAQLPVEKGKPAEAKALKAPEVPAAKLQAFDAFFSGLPEGFLAVSPANLNTELAGATKPFLLDVRTADEVKADGYIKDSVFVLFSDLMKTLDKLPKDKAAAIVIYCKSGHRGGMALLTLKLLGYTNVRNLGGGLSAWLTAQLPVTK